MQTATANPRDWATTPQLRAFRERVLSWTPEQINTGWEDVLVPQGAADLGVILGDEALLDWTVRWLDFHLDAGMQEKDGRIHSGLGRMAGKSPNGLWLNDFCGNWGFPLVAAGVLPSRDNPRWRDAILRITDFILDKAVRTDDGTITHGGGVANIWVDTLYYSAPVLAHAYAVSQEQRYADAAVEQCLLHAKHLRNKQTGLWHHDCNPKLGTRTINLWSRGNGWIICALGDVLSIIPKTTAHYDQVLYLYRSLAEAIFPLQHSSGLWRVDPQNPDAHLETSGTSMILYGLCVGIRESWLERYVFSAVERGYRELLTWIDSYGRLLGSQYPAGCGGWDNFKLTPFGENTYTTGFFMRLTALYNKLRQ